VLSSLLALVVVIAKTGDVFDIIGSPSYSPAAWIVAFPFALVLGVPSLVVGLLGWPGADVHVAEHVKQVLAPTPQDEQHATGSSLAAILPSLPFRAPDWMRLHWPTLTEAIFRDEAVVCPWESYAPKPSVTAAASEPAAPAHPFDDELWIYVNGIGNSIAAAQASARLLNRVFHRPITLVYNPTDSIPSDLLECVAGKIKLWQSWVTEPRNLLSQLLFEKLAEVARGKRSEKGANGAASTEGCSGKKKLKRIVLIAHSQGTIIAANALADVALGYPEGFHGLPPLDPAERTLAMKDVLEVYLFANCSHQLDAEHTKRAESLCNQFDPVALLGALHPAKNLWRDFNGNPISIGGKTLPPHTGAYGHLLAKHYMRPLVGKHAFHGSWLHQYMHGGGAIVNEATAR
jgi:hypothetical protein